MQTKTEHFAIFGDPVTHSISPLMHNYALRGLGVDACYGRYRLTDGKQLRQTFFALGVEGVNVTVPHKEAAWRACDEIQGIAKEIEAVNTIVREGDHLIGYNTDAPGFIKSASAFGKIESVLILGAGGTARALATAFGAEGVRVTILNRSEGRLAYFQERGFPTFTWDRWPCGHFDLLVNTTSAGLTDATLPAPEDILENLLQHTSYAIDVIYNRNTPFIQKARSMQIPVKDGSEMLLYQGVLALELFLKGRYREADLLPYMQKAF